MGDVLRAQGDLAGALQAYRETQTILTRLAAADPSNAGWQRDLSVSHNKVGDVLRAQGDLAGALKAYRESLAVAARLAAADPSNAGWQRDLWVSCWRMAEMAEKSGTGDALEWWRKAYEQLSRMKERGIMLPTDEQYLGQLREKAGLK
jgi:tetratricopeptide (TPR) repeat protein